MFRLVEIRKAADGLNINQALTLEEALKERAAEVIGLSPVQIQGQVSHENGLYLLDYQMTYTITLPSSRSLQPVDLMMEVPVNEVFITEADAADKAELIEEDLVMVLDEDSIDLQESVLDNILLNLPIQVLTDDEKNSADLPSGQNWSVMTESQYQAQKEEEKQANNPFASLNGLFDD